MTDLYAVVGNPIGHTKSPLIHSMFAEAMAQDLVYIAIEGPVGGFAGRIDEFRRGRGRGLNVTTPFKLDAFAYATDLSERARLAGAVNAMKFENGRAYAENFDGVGLIADIERNLGWTLAGKRVLMLGAGGAARGAAAPFLAAKPAILTVVNRSVEKARSLAAQFHDFGDIVGLEYADLAHHAPFDLVVNATSASSVGELPPVPAASFAGGCLAYDMAYGRGLTRFLRLAHSAGAGQVADGVGMLVEQAAGAFEWWRGARPDTRPVIDRLSTPLS
jgi:shikimate dehydrogenase